VIALVELKAEGYGILLGHAAKMHGRTNLDAAHAEPVGSPFRHAELGPRGVDFVLLNADDRYALRAGQLDCLGAVLLGDVGNFPQQVKIENYPPGICGAMAYVSLSLCSMAPFSGRSFLFPNYYSSYRHDG
jgi:hypothetical protein